MMATLNINCIVKCKKSKDLKKPFVGKVIEVTDEYVVVNILNNDPSERYIAYGIDYTTQVDNCDVNQVNIRHIGKR
ncbi:hypothetical protein [Pediococcus stilesii]|uniref:DUF2187 domain-containing protein n=1 Tax=Pediococcus stilesii TaxID=331679 RepID=A0A0R2KYZ3_9LACO|nr:hypothetical protein [Pediococcus stilesii]KRN94609.1 hypothetical protein IV81_GL001246 [Pediococcus stilesii]